MGPFKSIYFNIKANIRRGSKSEMYTLNDAIKVTNNLPPLSSLYYCSYNQTISGSLCTVGPTLLVYHI